MKQKMIGSTQQKILLLLLGGITLSLTRSPKRYWRVVKEINKEWKQINRQSLERAVNGLYRSKLLNQMTDKSGMTTLVLSENGKKRALIFNLENIKIKKPEKWDGVWRVVISDVPEKLKNLRDTLRERVLKMGFYPLQKSVFVHPFNCSEEIEFITEFYNGKKFVRFILAHHIDNELDLKKHFNLI